MKKKFIDSPNMGLYIPELTWSYQLTRVSTQFTALQHLIIMMKMNILEIGKTL